MQINIGPENNANQATRANGSISLLSGLTITWPSNIKQLFTNVNINQKILIQEGKEELKFIKQKTFNK